MQREGFEPKKLFKEEEEESLALKKSPARRPISKEQLERLQMAPKRPNRPKEVITRVSCFMIYLKKVSRIERFDQCVSSTPSIRDTTVMGWRTGLIKRITFPSLLPNL